MIYAKNEHALDYRGIHPNLDLALEHIRQDFLSRLGERREDLLPGEVWCTKFTYETLHGEECFFEAHKKFLDIHLMLSGSERVEIAPPTSLEPLYSRPDDDFYAYRGQGHYKLELFPGDFLVVFPGDAHKIKMRASGSRQVTKAVFKIRIH